MSWASAKACNSSSDSSLTRWHQRRPRYHQRASSIRIAIRRDWHTGRVSGVELELRVAWQRHLGSSPTAATWFDEVLGAYRAEGRHYHGVRHVGWVVRHVEALAVDHPVDDLAATVAAAFFHDAVYDATRGDNEAESAAMAERAVREIGWPEPACRHVADLVLATAGH